jgi:hypothetical protein
MSFKEKLRAMVSVEGIRQKSVGQQLRVNLEEALQQKPPAKQKAKTIAKQKADQTVGSAGSRQTVFVTTASLATFPVASGVIMVIWKLLQTLLPSCSTMNSPIIPLLLAILLGFFLLYIDLTDPEREQTPYKRDIVIKVGITIINSLFLAAAVLGIDTAIGGQGGQSTGS